jgi:hypothetical protein
MTPETKPEKLALFTVTCATHGEIAGNIGMEAIKDIIEAHRELTKCDAYIKVGFGGYTTSLPRPEVS